MAGTPVTWLTWQVRRVRRRLFIQHLVNATIVAWVSACAIFATWWLARPFILEDALKPWMDWTAGGSLLLLATIAAVVVALRRAPSPVTAALSLDDRFQLRERITSSLTLAPELHSTAAGQALLADAEERVSKLDVRSRFPVRLGWRSVLVPVSIAALFLLAIFYEPVVKTAQGSDVVSGKPLSADVVKELEQKKQEFLQRPKKDAKQEQRLKSEEIQKIEAQIQEILKRPMTTTDEVKDRLAELTKLEEKKKSTKDESERIQAFKEQMQKLDRLSKKEKNDQDKDESKDLRDALKDGDLDKAKQAADRLSKKIKDDQLNKKEKDHLENEMTDLKNDLDKLKDEVQKQLDEKHEQNEQQRQEREKQIEKQKNEGKIDKEEAERQKKEIQQERKKELQEQQQQKKDLDDLAKKMGECEKCMKSGDREGASKALHDAAKQLEQMRDTEQANEEMQDELEHLQRLREGVCKGCNGQCKGGDEEGDAETLSRQQNAGGVGKGRRGDKGPLDSKGIDSKEKGAFDKKGAKIQIGTASKAERVIGKKGVSLEGEIQQAGQDAPDAVDTQRIPRGYKDSTKGYFKNIGNQKTGETDPPK